MSNPAKAPAEQKISIDSVRLRAPKLQDTEVDYGVLGEVTGFSVKLVWILGYSLLARHIGDSAITPQRFSMLELVGSNPGLPQTQLAAALGLSRPAATVCIDFWQQRGCVQRRTEPGDRRSFGIYLTPAGERELARLRECVRASDQELTGALEPAELAELRRLLAKIHQ
ncbi:conserved hypothetical protein [Altererythrobacter sp. B11]|uniref:MarR family winged helix-turn-helix transcriptional regulator n=1 Tax=Altererythrobacter sp. B11 TaxID=2060312 RepID=UPI000DC73391|nr:MarR family winged helix-turn-helix transcriptional regulator [Altererythrobacter sp. B11]BBC71170.1 conserved hypothetical protein [Altererythrobacter sp. B11]